MDKKISSLSIEKLVNEALAVEAEAAKEAGALGYMARALVQATMPHKRVLIPNKDAPQKFVEASEFSRKNGLFTLVMMSPSKIGLPYGSIPRLLMAWITTEAGQSRSKELILGDSLSAFMRELGLNPTGGRWGNITRLKSQMKKLFAAAISCTYDDGQNWGIRNIQPVETANLWWNPKKPDQATLSAQEVKCKYAPSHTLISAQYKEIMEIQVLTNVNLLSP